MVLVTEPLWLRVMAWSAAGILGAATLIWSSGSDMLLGGVLLFVLGGWATLGLWALAWFGRAARTRRPHWLRDWASVWLGCMAALVGSVAVGASGAPEAVRLGLSRGALIEAGERVLSGEHPSRGGLYSFSDTRVINGCAMLETGRFAVDSFGFAYCPMGDPGGFEHLGGSLYRYAHD